ncbi:MAG: hypothetical protein R3Y08_04270 [Rikenellaceae bacterium]
MKHFLTILSIFAIAVSCRTEEQIIPSTSDQVIYPDAEVGEIKGFFLLNEGNMGSNKATLDYFDYETGIYTKNIFAERNPDIVKELGDVGNDIKIYSERIYAVINCSNFIEVMDVSTAKHIGVVSIPNCRFITFKGNYGYVTSYAGAVQIDPNARLGYVAKIDLTTLEVVDQCTVGYQPDELVVVDDKLYVANSGGYRAPDYDTTISVIDLSSFEEIEKIEVAKNLSRLELDQYGFLWVSSLGDYYDTPSKTYVVDTQTNKVVKEFDLPNSNMTRSGDNLYIFSREWNYTTSSNEVLYAVIDTKEQEITDLSFIKDGTNSNITIPYGIAVNPESSEIFVTDATNYITPGKLYCYTPEGALKWSTTTGDIPTQIAFTTTKLQPLNEQGGTTPDQTSAYITKVLEYVPAPGQHTNVMPQYEEGDTQETMNQKVLEAIGNNGGGAISLGGYGGYVTVGFDHTIPNREGLRDFRVLGNAFYSSLLYEVETLEGGSCEPGIIMVAYDGNGNGVPDSDEWFEIAGSSHIDASSEAWYNRALECGNDVNFYSEFELTYSKPTEEPTSTSEFGTYLQWSDNKGNQGYIPKNAYYTQSYYPLWIDSPTLTFSGSRLPQNGIDESGNGSNYVLYKYQFGYSDNETNLNDESAIDIDWAVDQEGNRVELPGVDFIKIYTGTNQVNGRIGSCSTELSGIEDLHQLNIEIKTR